MIDLRLSIKLLILFSLLTISGCGFYSKNSTLQTTSSTSSNMDADLDTTSTLQDLSQRIFTEKDFSSFGLGATALRNQNEFSFKVQINPTVPTSTFRVVSFNAFVPGYIEFFQQNEFRSIQKFELDPNMINNDNIPLFFNVADINFDGYADIGIPMESGALWIAYQYWIYNPQTQFFVKAPVTKDFGKIHFGLSLTFDKTKKQIIATGVSSASQSYKNTYQYTSGRIVPVEEIEQENTVVKNEKANTDNPDLECKISTKKYVGGKTIVSTHVLNRACDALVKT